MKTIDADNVLKGIEELKQSPYANPRDDGARIHIQRTLDIVACLCVKNEPTVDAVEVVRCKDCRHWRRLWHNKPDGICRLYDISDGEFSTEENAYCSRGERRKDNGKA